MGVPQFTDKYDSEPTLTARDSVAHRTELANVRLSSVMFVYREHVAEHLRDVFETDHIKGFGGRVDRIRGTDMAIASGFGIGGTAVAALIEDLHVVGVDTIISAGTCGQLGPSSSHVLICERALRDEGVSHHYARPERFAMPHPDLTHALEAHFEASDVPVERASSWTTDAIYRETVAERDAYLQEGITCVEMEAASIFTVCAHLGMRSACVFVVSDASEGEDHRIAFHNPDVVRLVERVSEMTLNFLLHRGA